MPQNFRDYQITAPDGSKITINAPEGASDEDLIAFAKQNWKPKAAAPAKAPPSSEPSVAEPAPNNEVEDLIRRERENEKRNPIVPRPKPVAPPPKPKPKPKAGPGFAKRQAAAAEEGVLDSIFGGVDLVQSLPQFRAGTAMLGMLGDKIQSALGITEGEKVKGGLRGATGQLAHSAGVGQVDKSYAPKSAPERYTQNVSRFLGGSIVPGAGGGMAAGRKNAARVLTGQTLGAIGGGVGGQAAKDIFPNNPDAEVAGSLVGGLLGASPAAYKPINNKLYYNKHTQNPYAPHVAEIVKDYVRVTKDKEHMVGAPPGRAKISVKQINAVADSYVKNLDKHIDAADISPAEKAILKEAVQNKNALSMGDINALRTSDAGHAVADSLTKYKLAGVGGYTPEIKRGADGVAGHITDAVGAGVGFLTGGPWGAGVGASGSAALRFLKNRLFGAPGSDEAARVHAAERLMNRADIWDKIAQEVGPSGQIESRNALRQNYLDKLTATQKAKVDVQLKRQAKQALAASNARIGIKNLQENILPGDGFRKYVYDQTGLMPKEQDSGVFRLLINKKIGPEQFDMFLKDPNKLQAGNAGNAIIDRLKTMEDLPRDPKWQPSVDLPSMGGEPPVNIRNPIAYAATANRQQQVVANTIGSIQNEASLSAKAKAVGAAAAAKIGNLSNKAEAEAVAQQAIKDAPEAAEYLKIVLYPLVSQIK